MAVWFELEKSEDGIKNFLGCNWGFHDFRFERFTYVVEKDRVDILLKHDTDKQGRLLRFVDLGDMHTFVKQYYLSDWISSSGCFLTDDNFVIWIENSDYSNGADCKKHFSEIQDYAFWVKSKYLFWAITNKDGDPIEAPDDYADQTFEVYGKKESHHFDLKPFDGNWGSVCHKWEN